MANSRAHEWGTRQPPDWDKLGAACLRDDVDIELFHSSDADSKTTRDRHQMAIEICETMCPSSCFWACREYSRSMRESQMLGVMGGETPKQRIEAIRKENVKASQ